VAGGELQRELRVAPHRELRDRAPLGLREAGARRVDARAQHREWQREHHAVGGDLGAGVEAERPRRARAAHAGERAAGAELPAERGGHAGDEQVVAAAHLVLLVRRAEEPELPLARRAEQVDEVERALLVRVGAVLDGVRHVEQPAELRRAPARHGGVDPLGDAHRVEHPAARRGRGVERRVPGLDVVAVEALPHGLEVAHRVGHGVAAAGEVEERLGAGRLGPEHVVEREAELLRELADARVRLVDELPAVLGELRDGRDAGEGGEGAAVGVAAPAQAGVGLVDGGGHARLPEAVGAGQPGEAGADDGDPRTGRGRAGRRGGTRRAHEALGAAAGGQAGTGGGVAEQGAAGERAGERRVGGEREAAGAGARVGQLVGGKVGLVGEAHDAGERGDAGEQRSARHGRRGWGAGGIATVARARPGRKCGRRRGHGAPVPSGGAACRGRPPGRCRRGVRPGDVPVAPRVRSRVTHRPHARPPAPPAAHRPHAPSVMRGPSTRVRLCAAACRAT
jgi:hypothetical protein